MEIPRKLQAEYPMMDEDIYLKAFDEAVFQKNVSDSHAFEVNPDNPRYVKFDDIIKEEIEFVLEDMDEMSDDY